MEIVPGRVARSLAGRDKGQLLLVIGLQGNRALVCDGKERPLNRPKPKNPRHLETTPFTLPDEAARSDKALRRALGSIQSIYAASDKPGG